MKQFYKFDENKFYIEPIIFNFVTITGEKGAEITQITDVFGNVLERLPENVTEIRPPDGLYRGKFTGSEWIETGEAPTTPSEEASTTPPPKAAPLQGGEFDILQEEVKLLRAAILEVAGQLPANTRGLTSVSALQTMLECGGDDNGT